MITEVSSRKFWFLEDINHFLTDIGLKQSLSDSIILIIAVVCLFVLIVLFNKIGVYLVKKILLSSVKKTKTLWDDALLKRKFPIWLLRLISASIAMSLVGIIFTGFGDRTIQGVRIILEIYAIISLIMVFSSFLDAANDNYELQPAARYKSIKSYIQAGKVIIWIIGSIFMLAIVIGTNPTNLIIGLGASAAIVSLVFKDVILGFISSIQISAQDMIRPGDWIEVPSKRADGVVEDINITNVKIRNWDNSVTTVPIYTLVSDSFTNWRTMVESDGRRFKRPILIDILSIKALSDEEVDGIIALENIVTYDKRIRDILKTHVASPLVTNLGLYRAYLEAYLEEHPKMTSDSLRFVRELLNNENGLTIELYGFTIERLLSDHEHIVANIMDNAICMMPLFQLRPYQRPSDKMS